MKENSTSYVNPSLNPEMKDYLQDEINKGNFDPSCKTCMHTFLPLVDQGKKLHEVFAPRHKASDRCRSGKNPHCTCDTCF